MTPKERAAMQQALEALCQLHFAATERDKKNRVRWFDKAIDESVEAITALREALDNQEERGTNRYEGWVEVAEQAEQEPVAWYLDTFDEDGELEDREYNGINEFSFGRGNGTPLYAAPVRTKDLTDDEIVEALGYDKSYRLKRWVLDDARAVIAADREKNK